MINQIGRSQARTEIHRILKDLSTFNSTEKRSAIREQIRRCVSFPNGIKKAKCDWVIGESPGYVFTNVCRRCFENVYEVGKTTITERIKEIKKRVVSNEILITLQLLIPQLDKRFWLMLLEGV